MVVEEKKNTTLEFISENLLVCLKFKKIFSKPDI